MGVAIYRLRTTGLTDWPRTFQVNPCLYESRAHMFPKHSYLRCKWLNSFFVKSHCFSYQLDPFFLDYLQLLVAWIESTLVPLGKQLNWIERPLIFFGNFFLQELTEEGLPFLILFHMKEDTESLETFQNEVARQLISEKGRLFEGFIFICFHCLSLPFLLYIWPKYT